MSLSCVFVLLFSSHHVVSSFGFWSLLFSFFVFVVHCHEWLLAIVIFILSVAIGLSCFSYLYLHSLNGTVAFAFCCFCIISLSWLSVTHCVVFAISDVTLLSFVSSQGINDLSLCLHRLVLVVAFVCIFVSSHCQINDLPSSLQEYPLLLVLFSFLVLLSSYCLCWHSPVPAVVLLVLLFVCVTFALGLFWCGNWSFCSSSPWLVFHHGHFLLTLTQQTVFSNWVGKQAVPTSQAPSVVSVPWAITKIMRSTVIPLVSSVMVIGTSLSLPCHSPG